MTLTMMVCMSYAPIGSLAVTVMVAVPIRDAGDGYHAHVESTVAVAIMSIAGGHYHVADSMSSSGSEKLLCTSTMAPT